MPAGPALGPMEEAPPEVWSGWSGGGSEAAARLQLAAAEQPLGARVAAAVQRIWTYRAAAPARARGRPPSPRARLPSGCRRGSPGRCAARPRPSWCRRRCSWLADGGGGACWESEGAGHDEVSAVRTAPRSGAGAGADSCAVPRCRSPHCTRPRLPTTPPSCRSPSKQTQAPAPAPWRSRASLLACLASTRAGIPSRQVQGRCRGRQGQEWGALQAGPRFGAVTRGAPDTLNRAPLSAQTPLEARAHTDALPSGALAELAESPRCGAGGRRAAVVPQQCSLASPATAHTSASASRLISLHHV